MKRDETGMRGAPASFDALYAEHGNRIYRFCYRLCGQSADAEDLTQEVFLAAYQGLAGFAGRSSLATWLYRIAFYRWQRIRSRRGPETVPLEEDTATSPTAPDPSRSTIERVMLDQALETLPEALRETFLLVKVEGLKYREAAAVLGVPTGTVQWRVHEAVLRLRAQLAETLTKPEPGSSRPEPEPERPMQPCRPVLEVERP